MHHEAIEVVAPARLHFGLLSFGQPAVRQFGGCGVMLKNPCVRLSFIPAARFSVSGACARRVAAFAGAWSQRTGRELKCEISVEAFIPPHVGLGSGTQLALSVAAGLFRLLMPETPLRPGRLAASVGRGQRSAVGTYGFALGGLIAERGKWPDEPLGELLGHVSFPPAWRFVLLRPPGEQGRNGRSERAAFATLPPVPVGTTKRLLEILEIELLPACRKANCEEVGHAMHAFGQLAGSCFAACQGGAFASPRIDRLVRTLRELGVAGVGQSSWGPTVFALTPSAQAAQDLWRNFTVKGSLETQIDLGRSSSLPPRTRGRALRNKPRWKRGNNDVARSQHRPRGHLARGS